MSRTCDLPLMYHVILKKQTINDTKVYTIDDLNINQSDTNINILKIREAILLCDLDGLVSIFLQLFDIMEKIYPLCIDPYNPEDIKVSKLSKPKTITLNRGYSITTIYEVHFTNTEETYKKINELKNELIREISYSPILDQYNDLLLESIAFNDESIVFKQYLNKSIIDNKINLIGYNYLLILKDSNDKFDNLLYTTMVNVINLLYKGNQDVLMSNGAVHNVIAQIIHIRHIKCDFTSYNKIVIARFGFLIMLCKISDEYENIEYELKIGNESFRNMGIVKKLIGKHMMSVLHSIDYYPSNNKDKEYLLEQYYYNILYFYNY